MCRDKNKESCRVDIRFEWLGEREREREREKQRETERDRERHRYYGAVGIERERQNFHDQFIKKRSL